MDAPQKENATLEEGLGEDSVPLLLRKFENGPSFTCVYRDITLTKKPCYNLIVAAYGLAINSTCSEFLDTLYARFKIKSPVLAPVPGEFNLPFLYQLKFNCPKEQVKVQGTTLNFKLFESMWIILVDPQKLTDVYAKLFQTIIHLVKERKFKKFTFPLIGTQTVLERWQKVVEMLYQLNDTMVKLKVESSNLSYHLMTHDSNTLGIINLKSQVIPIAMFSSAKQITSCLDQIPRLKREHMNFSIDVIKTTMAQVIPLAEENLRKSKNRECTMLLAGAIQTIGLNCRFLIEKVILSITQITTDESLKTKINNEPMIGNKMKIVKAFLQNQPGFNTVNSPLKILVENMKILKQKGNMLQHGDSYWILGELDPLVDLILPLVTILQVCVKSMQPPLLQPASS